MYVDYIIANKRYIKCGWYYNNRCVPPTYLIHKYNFTITTNKIKPNESNTGKILINSGPTSSVYF